jgi:hypothetical protein
MGTEYALFPFGSIGALLTTGLGSEEGEEVAVVQLLITLPRILNAGVRGF